MMRSTTVYAPVAARSPGFTTLLLVLLALLGLGLWAAHNMESQGHYITGMNNQIVWGVPHVFAVFLIVVPPVESEVSRERSQALLFHSDESRADSERAKCFYYQSCHSWFHYA